MVRTGRSGKTRGVARALACALAAGALWSPLPARAGIYSGSVLVPLGHPAVARELNNLSEAFNGLVGYVVDLRTTKAVGTPYTIHTVSGAGAPQFDVYFYRSLASFSPVCSAPREEPDGPNQEKGTVTCDAKFAIVVLTPYQANPIGPRPAAAASFRLTV